MPKNRVFWTLCQIASLVLDLPRMPFKLTDVRSSVRPFFCYQLFSGSAHLVFSDFLHSTVARNGDSQKVMEPDFRKKNFFHNLHTFILRLCTKNQAKVENPQAAVGFEVSITNYSKSYYDVL